MIKNKMTYKIDRVYGKSVGPTVLLIQDRNISYTEVYWLAAMGMIETLIIMDVGKVITHE